MSTATKTPAEQPFDLSGGALCLDFANTLHEHAAEASPARDDLAGYADLVRFAREAGVIGEVEARRLRATAGRDGALAERTFRHARELRETIYRVIAPIASGGKASREDLDALSKEVALAFKHGRIDRSGERYRWSWDDAARDLERPLWDVARSAADLLESDRLQLVRGCASDTCDWLFIDESRNHSRRWCDMKSCGNRAKARRFYERTKGKG